MGNTFGNAVTNTKEAYNNRVETALDKKLAQLDVSKIEAEVFSDRKYLRGLNAAISSAIACYQPWAMCTSANELQLPHLSVWARSGTRFVGSPSAAEQLQMHAAHLHLLAEIQVDFHKRSARAHLTSLTSAKAKCEEGLKVCRTHLEAVVKLDELEKQQIMNQANGKPATAEFGAQLRDTAALIRRSKDEALKSVPVTIEAATQALMDAFVALQEGQAAFKQSAAAVMGGTNDNELIAAYMPPDSTDGVTAAMQDAGLKLEAWVGKGAGFKEHSAPSANGLEQLREARRLLKLTAQRIQAWQLTVSTSTTSGNLFSSSSATNMHAPKDESIANGRLLDALRDPATAAVIVGATFPAEQYRAANGSVFAAATKFLEAIEMFESHGCKMAHDAATAYHNQQKQLATLEKKLAKDAAAKGAAQAPGDPGAAAEPNLELQALQADVAKARTKFHSTLASLGGKSTVTGVDGVADGVATPEEAPDLQTALPQLVQASEAFLGAMTQYCTARPDADMQTTTAGPYHRVLVDVKAELAGNSAVNKCAVPAADKGVCKLPPTNAAVAQGVAVPTPAPTLTCNQIMTARDSGTQDI